MSELDLFLAWMRQHDLWPCVTAEEAEFRRDQFRHGEIPWESAEAAVALTKSTLAIRSPRVKRTWRHWRHGYDPDARYRYYRTRHRRGSAE